MTGGNPAAQSGTELTAYNLLSARKSNNGLQDRGIEEGIMIG